MWRSVWGWDHPLSGILYMPKVRLIVKLNVSLHVWFILGLKLVHAGKNFTHCRSAPCICHLKEKVNIPSTDPEYVGFS